MREASVESFIYLILDGQPLPRRPRLTADLVGDLIVDLLTPPITTSPPSVPNLANPDPQPSMPSPPATEPSPALITLVILLHHFDKFFDHLEQQIDSCLNSLERWVRILEEDCNTWHANIVDRLKNILNGPVIGDFLSYLLLLFIFLFSVYFIFYFPLLFFHLISLA